ncbi:MAG: DUF3857 domain-containing protein [Psychroserpens sp.]|uniref:DUF3857 domain-containing protein n=1 Tax=Psychroserpens sp. TaxID=2020870 RepID=UPI0030023666
MRLKSIITVFLMSFSSIIFAQDDDLFKAYETPSELLVKTNAVIRYNDVVVEVDDYNRFTLRKKRIVTIFNKQGISDQGTVVSYNKNRIIKTLEARIYDENGNEIKKYKKGDFEDVSAVSGGTLYSDNRLKYLDYTPIDYPYTIELEVEVDYKSTAFFPGWRPIEGFYASTQHSEYRIINNSDTEIKLKASNFEDYNIEKHSEYHYSAKNLSSLKPEAYSPSFETFAPILKVAMVEFEMEGVRGINNNWEDFGQWMHDKLLSGTEALPSGIKTEIKELTKNASTDLEKARIVYNYMQDKTRYISVQVGIGGWKPMLAEDVERLGYADCKGLSNYTKALLNEVGVEAHYAVIYGGSSIMSVDKEFSATEGNHVVLYVPNEEKNIWLECTSQTNPFGFIASFTDDRDALLITPEGGKIMHTTTYKTEDNLQTTHADVQLLLDGSIKGNVTIQTKGYQYALHEGVQNDPLREQELYFKNYWDYINNLSVENIVFDNDKDAIVFTEKVKVSSSSFAKKSGKRLLFQPNLFNRITNIPTRYETRTLDFEIERGYTDEDEFVIKIDPALKIEAMPKPVEISNQFGVYKFSIEKRSENELVYKRTQVLNKGYFPKEDYDDFRSFMSAIVKHDKTKVVLTN